MAEPKITRDELLRRLRGLITSDDPEWAHGEADDLLLAFINDKEVSQAFYKIKKWYA
jgi:hypothetical protein